MFVFLQTIRYLFLFTSLGTLLTPVICFSAEIPVGFASGVTGGGSAPAVHPRTVDELRTALCATTDSHGACTDTAPRVISLDRAFDFRGTVLSDGSPDVTETGCMANVCTNGSGQWGIDGVTHFCQSRPKTTITYDKAGLQHLKIGSNKTLVGQGSKAGIKGIGLFVGDGAKNVIIRNLTISDINPRVVWGGDALTLDNTDGVWIDHDTFARIGRQMIVTGFGSASHVTISDNEFDGRTQYSATCDGHHYFVWLFLGKDDTLTLAGNYIHHTSGRAPHSGGMNGAQVRAQLVNNLFSHLTYQGAIMSRTDTSYLLVEGNYFEDVTHPLFNDSKQPGNAFALFGSTAGDACQSTLGRKCVGNDVSSSGSDFTPQDQAVLDAFRLYRRYLVHPAAPSLTRVSVLNNAGVGHI
ncbi:polysaccharide lyase family 1 protein [Pseudomonas sp. PS02290]|uniref:polysaccharide lyase family 1 protein n=1 Tax=Pseudomonas sp. PS02290 TaxID=2991430 RepID=UPI00249C483E|nr:polysaccharide lyase family 1 protein [Pseudomonas sp. PS02290]